MKKILSFILTAAIGLSSLTAVRAAETDGIEKALQTVKSRIGDTDEYESFDSHLGNEGYAFSWNSENKYLSVYVTEDGIIKSYYKYEDTYDWDRKAKFPARSAEEAEAAARDFINRINPDIASELKITADTYGSLNEDYWIYVEQYYDGYRVLDSHGSIEFNNDLDEVTSFYLNYIKVTPPDKSALLDEDAAKQAFKEKIGMRLVYESYYDDETGKSVYYPVYEYADYSKKIDAMTGDVVNPYEEMYSEQNEYEESALSADGAAFDKGFTDAEMAELNNIAGLISKDEAKQIVRSNKYIKVSDMKLSSYHLSKSWSDDDEYCYNMYFRGDDNKSAYVTLDAKTGEILTMWQSADEGEKENKELKKEAAAAFAGDKINEYRYDEDSDCFIRVANGLDVMNNNISITAYGDTVTYYSIYYDKDASFPSVDGAISADQAADAMFSLADYEIYLYSDSEGNTKSFYELSDYNNISPFTGKAVGYDDKELTDDHISDLKYTDIENHWAKDIVTTLANYGIGFYESEFKPDAAITAGEFKELLSNVFYNLYYFDFASYFKGHNIPIAEGFDENAVITRMEGAMIFAGAMGADEYADYDIYVSPFSDVSEHKGYAALLNAMGVIGGSGGKFRPNDNLTRAEAAAMIYNYLSR